MSATFKLYISQYGGNVFRNWSWAIVPASEFDRKYVTGSMLRHAAAVSGYCFTERGARAKGIKEFRRFDDAVIRPVPQGYLVDVDADAEAQEFERLQRRLRKPSG